MWHSSKFNGATYLAGLNTQSQNGNLSKILSSAPKSAAEGSEGGPPILTPKTCSGSRRGGTEWLALEFGFEGGDAGCLARTGSVFFVLSGRSTTRRENGWVLRKSTKLSRSNKIPLRSRLTFALRLRNWFMTFRFNFSIFATRAAEVWDRNRSGWRTDEELGVFSSLGGVLKGPFSELLSLSSLSSSFSLFSGLFSPSLSGSLSSPSLSSSPSSPPSGSPGLPAARTGSARMCVPSVGAAAGAVVVAFRDWITLSRSLRPASARGRGASADAPAATLLLALFAPFPVAFAGSGAGAAAPGATAFCSNIPRPRGVC